MSIYIERLRELACNGNPVCDQIADEILDDEKAYELLFKENSRLRERAAENEMLRVELAEAKARVAELEGQLNSLARTVMADQVSNDSAAGIRDEDIFTLWKVTMPSGESTYCGVQSAAKAIARTTGIVELVRIPRRDFKLLHPNDFDAVTKGVTP